MGSVGSQALYESFSAAHDKLHVSLLKYKILSDIQSFNCFTFIYDSMRGMT